MPAIPITLRPGINTELTAALNAAGYSESSSVRFFQGLAQKSGGFKKFTQVRQSPATVDLGRSAVALRAWAALSGILELAIAGENYISLFQAGVVSNITPITQRELIPISITTFVGDQFIRVNDATNNPHTFDWVRFRAPISVAGIVLDGPYAVVSLGAGLYTVIAATLPTSAVTAGGVARQFTTTINSSTVAVYFPNHGLSTDQLTRITDPTLVGGVTLEGNYVVTVVDADNYTIVDDETATATATVLENGGNLALTFYTPRAPGTGSGQNTLEAEFVTLDNWGEFLVAIPKDGPIYIWQPANGPSSPLTNTLTAPQANTFGFVSNQQQILIVCGTVNPATNIFDPLLVRWSDAGDYTDFTVSVTNQAGSFRLQLGSACIAGLAIAGRALIWTDLGLYAMQYEGLPLVWGFQPIGVNCGLIGPNAMGVLGDNVMWMSQNQFYVSGGGAAPQIVPCSIWDRVFKNLSTKNGRETACVTNSFFNEVTWYVPQNDGSMVAARLQVDSGNWDYTSISIGDNRARSVGINQNVFGPPLAAAPDGIVYQEETGTDADDVALTPRLLTGIAMLSDGEEFVFFRRIIPDIKFADSGTAAGMPSSQFAPTGQGVGTVQVTVYIYRNPQEAPRAAGPYLINARTRSIPCRGRGRGLQFEFASADLGSFWRIGKMSYSGQPDGKGG